MKIAIIGAGNIGGIVALLAIQRNLGEIVLFDVLDGKAKGKALDLMQMATLLDRKSVSIYGTSSYTDIINADICVITAGVPRASEKESREELLQINLATIRQVACGVREYAPNAFCIIATNPVNVMSYIFYKLSKISKNLVVGMAGILDSARFRTFLSEELRVSARDISTIVLGDHNKNMIPLINFSSVAGVSLMELISMGFLKKEKLDKIIERVRNGGEEIMNLTGNCSAFYAPALSIVEMMESYIDDKKRVLPCSAYLNGEYSLSDMFLGVPVIIGNKGIEQILEIQLEPDERIKLINSSGSMRETISKIKL